ncbi:glycosyltransferase [Verrucomicrobiaceae bacterium N1E253]|uniref:Glycosyltransferase n=1 Tax=Oceaniferula marina TaxID=2748318 RepID=A0A851GFN0_9BACT|nr:glycosyltransferase [Oceaniferula marina]NWK54085.1 glycosyltransferase [Oceaniferula marina]
MLVILPILALVCAPAFWFVLGKPRYMDHRKIGKALPDNNPPLNPKVSIIIPARNEEQNISKLLNSLARQSQKPHEIIVVNDQSEDSTAAVAAQGGARVHEGKKAPQGWLGKSWACQQGADTAHGELLLFLDADTELKPTALEYLILNYEDKQACISVAPYHRIEKNYEEFSAFFNVLMLAGANAFGIHHKSNPDSALFGQCLFISKHDYQRVGGHTSVKGEILENFSLARQLAKCGIPRDCRLGRGQIEMRMFPGGMSELISSWKKGFSSGAAQANPTALALSSIWITGAMFSLVSLACMCTPFVPPAFLPLSLIAYIVYVFQCLIAFRMAGNFSWVNALCYPVSLIFYQYLFFSSIIDKRRGRNILWKGRPTS